jgi:hypothetical protein
MKNPVRLQGDIKQIVIDAEVPDLQGWAVHLHYKDGKSASFAVDYDRLLMDGMLEEVFRSIKFQMAGAKGKFTNDRLV